MLDKGEEGIIRQVKRAGTTISNCVSRSRGKTWHDIKGTVSALLGQPTEQVGGGAMDEVDPFCDQASAGVLSAAKAIQRCR